MLLLKAEQINATCSGVLRVRMHACVLVVFVVICCVPGVTYLKETFLMRCADKYGQQRPDGRINRG